MATYLVRIKPDRTNPRDLVGVFVADSIHELSEYVDECCDTFECEYTELGNGGIYLSSPALPVPFDLPEDGAADFFKDASLTETWFGQLINRDDLAKWTSLGEPAWSTHEERQALMDSAIAKLEAYEELKRGK